MARTDTYDRLHPSGISVKLAPDGTLDAVLLKAEERTSAGKSGGVVSLPLTLTGPQKTTMRNILGPAARLAAIAYFGTDSDTHDVTYTDGEFVEAPKP